MPSSILVGGAVLLFVGTYLVDAAFQAAGVDLAGSMDAYPRWAGIGLGSRLVVMAALGLLLAAVAARVIGRGAGTALLSIGLLGFVVLPIVALQEPVTAGRSTESLATALGPGTIGRWLAGAILVVGAIAVLRPRADEVAARMPAASTVPEHEPT
jgi:hypothetical protein